MANQDMKARFKGAKLIDYTGTVKGFKQMERFQQEFIDLVRNDKDGTKAVVVVDRGIGGRYDSPMIARDHMNLSGNNPLVGPNNPIGERFPIVQGIYLTECWKGANTGIVAGLKDGVKPQEEDQELLRAIGADISTYNLVPSMLVAAHAGWKVLGIVLPDGCKLNDEQLGAINELTGGE